MPPGALINSHIDLVQFALVAFVLFFAGLIIFLRRQDKREGYPMRASMFSEAPLLGFPEPPADRKVYHMMDGTEELTPHFDPEPPMQARPMHRFIGTPLLPVGNPLLAAVGPATYVMRRDEPLRYEHDKLQVLPLRIATDWSVSEEDADPRGMTVLDARRRVVGTVGELWVDRSVKILRYLEVELSAELGGRRVLLPIYYADIDERRRRVRVRALHAEQFTDVPELAQPDTITAREEDRVNAYYAGGEFFGRRVPSEEREAQRRW